MVDVVSIILGDIRGFNVIQYVSSENTLLNEIISGVSCIESWDMFSMSGAIDVSFWVQVISFTSTVARTIQHPYYP